MRLTKARVQGFQSFRDSGELEFFEGINLIIGQNNSGKSALLRALLPVLTDDRHRTPEMWETFRLRPPEVSLTIDASGADIYGWILRSGTQQFFPVTQSDAQNVEAFMQEIFERPKLSIAVTRTLNADFIAPYPSHQLFE